MKVHYRDEGKGFPLVLLHGTFASLHTWDGWTELLKHRYRIIRLDLPGFGLTGPRPDRVYSVGTYVNFLKAFLDQIGIDKCYMAGSSLGGWITWEFAYRYPRIVRRMILIDAAGFNDKDSIPLAFKLFQNPILKGIPQLKSLAEIVNTPKKVTEIFLRNAYGDPSRISKKTIQRYHDMTSRKGNREAFLTIANANFDDSSKHVKEIETPTLVLWGDHDRWIPIANAYKFNYSLINSQLIIYEGVGHIPMEEVPERSANDALHFLESSILERNRSIQTALLCDLYPEKVQAASPIFKLYGGLVKTFHGKVVTIRANFTEAVEDVLREGGKGKVLVIDNGGLLRNAIIGLDQVRLAHDYSWEGIVVYGTVRNWEAIKRIPVGIKALATFPMYTPPDQEIHERNTYLNIADISLEDGNFIYADSDGIVVSSNNLFY
ncbi:ribonuclease E activity regulator RraA [Limibacter armeniacum]|uniref:ribonuclease E activity regulator RraA n=1 Tax=Limibacter armeniacum TaxID=466084 RepID=UPI002FE546CA